MKELFEKLKEHLKLKKDSYVIVHEWCGDTETGFYDEVEIDMDALMAEIDEFAGTFQKGGGKNPLDADQPA